MRWTSSATLPVWSVMHNQSMFAASGDPGPVPTS